MEGAEEKFAENRTIKKFRGGGRMLQVIVNNSEVKNVQVSAEKRYTKVSPSLPPKLSNVLTFSVQS